MEKIIRIDSVMPDGRGGTYPATHYWLDGKWLTPQRQRATCFSCKRELDRLVESLRARDRDDSVTVEDVP